MEHDDMSRIIEVKPEIVSQLSFFEPAEIVRPDINVAKWAGFIFSSPWSKDLHEEKKIIFNLSGGRRASITIIPAHGRKRPTTTTQRILYALFQIWEESGKPANGRFLFSARQVCSVSGLKWAGKKTGEMIQEHLSILNSSTIDWEQSFSYDGVLETQKDEMSLIDAKSYLSREKMINREFFYAQHRVRLNQDLVDNMLAGKTKPFNYRAFISIKNDAARTLYNLLDNFLAKKNHWERRSKGLIQEDLELLGKRYNQRRIRLARLKELVKELQGKELSSGILSLSIKKTVDKKDYKIVADKTPKKVILHIPKKIANDRENIPNIIETVLNTLKMAGTVDEAKTKKVIRNLALWYPAEMLYNIASVVKIDYQGKIKKSVIKTFMYLVHVEAHKKGLKWIKDCGKNCKYQPQQVALFQDPQKITVKNTPQKKNIEEKAKELAANAKKEAEAKKQAEKEKEEVLQNEFEEERKQSVKTFWDMSTQAEKEQMLKDFEESNIFKSKVKQYIVIYKLYKKDGIKDMTVKYAFNGFIIINFLDKSLLNIRNWKEAKGLA